jgi:Flp pilus assembly protein TadD
MRDRAVSFDRGGPPVPDDGAGGMKKRLERSAGRRMTPMLAAGLLAISLFGCAGSGNLETVDTTASLQRPDDIKYYPSDEPYRLGVEHFNRGHYGMAERYFRDAVESAPKDAAAWIGLAASYDRIQRFDLADRAYARAISLEGETTQVLNNRGYSYMLRGKLDEARAQFVKSSERDPDNPYTINNLRLLEGSYRYIERPPHSRVTGHPARY